MGWCMPGWWMGCGIGVGGGDGVGVGKNGGWLGHWVEFRVHEEGKAYEGGKGYGYGEVLGVSGGRR